MRIQFVLINMRKSEDVMLLLLALFCFLLTTLIYIIGLRQSRNLSYTVNQMLNNKNPKPYIHLLEQMLLHTKDGALKNTIRINLSVGYSIQKNYSAALHILNQVDLTYLNTDDVLFSYCSNRACNLFMMDQASEACQLIEQNRGLFEKYLSNPHFGCPAAIDLALFCVTKGDTNNSAAYLRMARPRAIATYNELFYREAENRINRLAAQKQVSEQG